MKKVLSLILALVLCLSLCACGGKSVDEPTTASITDPVVEPTTEAATEPTTEPTTVATEPPIVMENENVKIDGLLVDSSYVDTDSSALKMVYVFLTITSTDKNLSVDSIYSTLTIGANEYDSDFYKGSCANMPNYYYSSYIEDLYVGTSIKLALTFKVPEGDLSGSKDVSLSDSSMPLSGLKFTTDEFVFCESLEELAEKADPEGWELIRVKREPADKKTTKNVRASMNGYYWTFYVSAGTTIQTYELEFFAPNSFELRTPLLTNSGTYEVLNGFIVLTYDSSGITIEIEYEFVDGEFKLYCSDAFSIYE